MRTGQWATLGGVTALVAPITISTGGVALLPIAILSGIVLVRSIPSALSREVSLPQSAKAADGGGEMDGVSDFVPFSHKAAKDKTRQELVYEAYQLGCRTRDDIFGYVRSKGHSITNSPEIWQWASQLIFQWDNTSDDVIQL